MSDESYTSARCQCCQEEDVAYFCFTCNPNSKDPIQMCSKCSTSVHIGPMKFSHKVKALISAKEKEKLKQLYVEIVGKNQNKYEVVSTQLTDASYDLTDVQGHVQRLILELFETPLKNAVITKKRQLNTLVEEYYRNKKSLVESGINKCRELQLNDVSTGDEIGALDDYQEGEDFKKQAAELELKVQSLPWNGKTFEEFLPDFQTFSFNCQIEEKIKEITETIENIKLETKQTPVCPTHTLEEMTVKTDKEMFVYFSGSATPDGLFWLKIARREDETVYRILSYNCRKRLVVNGGAESPFVTEPQSLSTGLQVMVFHPNEKSWRRAVIENPQLTHDLKVSVIFVDFGNKMLVSVKDMIECSEEDCQIPYMAYPCSLTAHKESFSSRDQMWKLQDLGKPSNHRGPALLKAVFRQTLGTDDIQASCLPVWFVDLYTTDEEPVHINKIIQDMKLAGEIALKMSKDMRLNNGEAIPVVRATVDMKNTTINQTSASPAKTTPESSNQSKLSQREEASISRNEDGENCGIVPSTSTTPSKQSETEAVKNKLSPVQKIENVLKDILHLNKPELPETPAASPIRDKKIDSISRIITTSLPTNPEKTESGTIPESGETIGKAETPGAKEEGEVIVLEDSDDEPGPPEITANNSTEHQAGSDKPSYQASKSKAAEHQADSIVNESARVDNESKILESDSVSKETTPNQQNSRNPNAIVKPKRKKKKSVDKAPNRLYDINEKRSMITTCDRQSATLTNLTNVEYKSAEKSRDVKTHEHTAEPHIKLSVEEQTVRRVSLEGDGPVVVLGSRDSGSSIGSGSPMVEVNRDEDESGWCSDLELPIPTPRGEETDPEMVRTGQRPRRQYTNKSRRGGAGGGNGNRGRGNYQYSVRGGRQNYNNQQYPHSQSNNPNQQQTSNSANPTNSTNSTYHNNNQHAHPNHRNTINKYTSSGPARSNNQRSNNNPPPVDKPATQPLIAHT